MRDADICPRYRPSATTLGDDTMRGTLLDRALRRSRRPGTLYVHGEDFEILPARIRENLLKGRQLPGKRGPQMSSVSWRDTLTPRDVLTADGTAVTNTTTETIMCPDFTFAARALEVGDWFKYNLWFRHSTVITTPGTITFKLRWGGVAGTTLATSGAFAPDPDGSLDEHHGAHRVDGGLPRDGLLGLTLRGRPHRLERLRRCLGDDAEGESRHEPRADGNAGRGHGRHHGGLGALSDSHLLRQYGDHEPHEPHRDSRELQLRRAGRDA